MTSPLCMCFCNFLCDDTGHLHSERAPCLSRALVRVSELRTQATALLLMECHLYLLTWQTNCGCWDEGVWQNFSWKWKTWAITSRKTTGRFFANDNIWFFKFNNLNFWKLASATMTLTAFQFLRAFLKLVVNVTFEYCIMKCVNGRTQWSSIFQMTNAWCHKIMNGWKIHSKCKTPLD